MPAGSTGSGARRVPRPGAAQVSAGGDLRDDLVASTGADDQAAARLDGIDLTHADLELLDAHLALLGMIRVVPGTRGSGYTVTVAICDRCGRWMLSTGAVPQVPAAPSAAPVRW